MHPEGFHKDEEARLRCHACSRLEMPTEADLEYAKALIAAGYLSTSNKYRKVARVHVPCFEQAITFASDVPEWLRNHMRRSYEMWIHHGARCNNECVEHLELTIGEFKAFKQLGGCSA